MLNCCDEVAVGCQKNSVTFIVIVLCKKNQSKMEIDNKYYITDFQLQAFALSVAHLKDLYISKGKRTSYLLNTQEKCEVPNDKKR